MANPSPSPSDPRTPQQIEQAVIYERTRLFWFAHRQPSYIKRYTEQWGEFWDDRFQEDETFESPDMDDEDL